MTTDKTITRYHVKNSSTVISALSKCPCSPNVQMLIDNASLESVIIIIKIIVKFHNLRKSKIIKYAQYNKITT